MVNVDPKFLPGEAVFAKMRGYPYWPAKIEGVADSTPKKMKYHIYFYGTKQMAVCKEEDLCSYVEKRELYGLPKKYKGFNEGINQMDTELGLVPINQIQKIKTNLSILDAGKIISSLKQEALLVDLVLNLQTNLSVEKAHPDSGLRNLDNLLGIELNTLMFKRHPEVIYIIEKLQRYIGNVKNWNMSEDEEERFSSKAKLIQMKAAKLMNKIEDLFHPPEGHLFLPFFDQKVKDFKKSTKGMSFEDVYFLTRDPSECTTGGTNSSKK